MVDDATDSNSNGKGRVTAMSVHFSTSQLFKCRFTVGQLSVSWLYTVGQQLADSIPTVG